MCQVGPVCRSASESQKNVKRKLEDSLLLFGCENIIDTVQANHIEVYLHGAYLHNADY